MATAFSFATTLSCLQLAGTNSVFYRLNVNRGNNARTGIQITPHGLLRSKRKTDLKMATASSSDLATAADWGEPVSLGTVKLPPDVNLQKLEGFLFQYHLRQVDKIDGGVRLGYIRLVDGAIENLAHIDCVVSSGTGDSSAMFRALRCGKFKNEVPPAEPLIMQSLLQALKKSIELARA